MIKFIVFSDSDIQRESTTEYGIGVAFTEADNDGEIE